MLPRLFFTIDEAAVGHDFKHATGAGDKVDLADPIWPESPQFFRQTGGARLVVSLLAVFDGDVFDHSVRMTASRSLRKRT